MLGLSQRATERKPPPICSNCFLLKEKAREKSSNNNKKGKRHTQPLRLIKSSLAFNKQFFENKLMEKVTSLLLSKACHTALSHCYYKWNKSVAFLFISDALKGCISHWTLHFSFFHLHNTLRNSSWVIQPAMCAEPNLNTPCSKQNVIPQPLLSRHKNPCLSQSKSTLQKRSHEKEVKNSGLLKWCCFFTHGRW